MMNFGRKRGMSLGMMSLLFVAVLALHGCVISPCCDDPAPPPPPPPPVSDCGAIPTLDPSSSVILVQKNMPPNGEVGVASDYVVNVINLTDFPIHDVAVIETTPSNFEIVSSVPPVSSSEGGTTRWFLGNFTPRETKEVLVTGKPTGVGELKFCTDVEYVLPPCCSVMVVVQPNLKITKSMPSEALICDTIPITLVVSNTGTGVAGNVVVRESLPSGLKTLDGETEVVREVGSLQAGESKEIVLETKADKTGTFENYATASSGSGLSADSNTVTTTVSQPVLTISKTCTEETYVGLNANYSITVTNEGDAPAESTVVEDTIPANTSFVSAGDGGNLTASGSVVWNMGTLAPQGSRTVNLTLKADSIGEGTNSAKASAVCADAVSDSCATAVKGIPAILLEVIDIEDPINVGSVVTYVITVTNQGSATGTNITIVSELEEGTSEYVSSSGATSGSAVGNVITFDPLPALAPKDKAAWNLQVKAKASGDVRFKVTMNSDQIGRDVQETEATNFYE